MVAGGARPNERTNSVGFVAAPPVAAPSLMPHTGYHIGQLALICKFLGAPAMRYG
jgi:hypothetical protein